MKVTATQKILIALTAALIVFWCALFVSHRTDSIANYWFSALIGLVPLVGGIAAVVGFSNWSEYGGHLRKGMLFVGIGLLLWAAGEFIWAYYNIFAHMDIPYPSWADAGYLPSEFFYCVGAVYLASAASGDVGAKKPSTWFIVGLLSVLMFFFSYYILVTVARSGVLVTRGEGFVKTFLDIAYPFGDFLSVTLSVALSGLYFKFLAPRYRAGILCVLVGLVALFAADAAFSYTTNQNTYFNGNFSDLLSLIGLFLLAFGTLGFGEGKSLLGKRA